MRGTAAGRRACATDADSTCSARADVPFATRNVPRTDVTTTASAVVASAHAETGTAVESDPSADNEKVIQGPSYITVTLSLACYSCHKCVKKCNYYCQMSFILQNICEVFIKLGSYKKKTVCFSCIQCALI